MVHCLFLQYSANLLNNTQTIAVYLIPGVIALAKTEHRSPGVVPPIVSFPWINVAVPAHHF
jgi:hypothetical protein